MAEQKQILIIVIHVCGATLSYKGVLEEELQQKAGEREKKKVKILPAYYSK